MKISEKRRSPEQIVRELRKAEADIASGFRVQEVCRDLNIAGSTLHHWRKKYGDLEPGEAKRLKALEDCAGWDG